MLASHPAGGQLGDPAHLRAHMLLTLHLPFQAELQAMLGCLRKLLRSQPMSAGALYAAATGSRAPRPPSCARLTRRLLLNFMLWTAGGHAIARDIVTAVSVPSASGLVLLLIVLEGLAFFISLCTRSVLMRVAGGWGWGGGSLALRAVRAPSWGTECSCVPEGPILLRAALSLHLVPVRVRSRPGLLC